MCHTILNSGAFGLKRLAELYQLQCPIDLISVPFLLDLAYFNLRNGLNIR